jgi:hypothetical protein
LATDNNKKACGLCDAWNGYYQPTDVGTCVKSSSVVAAKPSQLKDLFNMGIKPSEAEFLKNLLSSIVDGIAAGSGF